jgi:putative oxidoreductase
MSTSTVVSDRAFRATPPASLAKCGDIVFPILRVVVGLLFALHGAQKLFGVLGGDMQPFLSQPWVGGVIELAGGALIALGLFMRPAAFLSSGTMAVAYVQFHWQGALDERFFPIVNHGELAVVYSFLFLYFACVGAGRYSLDARRQA